MTIAGYEVTEITRNSADIGCATLRPSTGHPGQTVLEVNGERVLRIGPKGVVFYPFSEGQGIAVTDGQVTVR